MTCQKNRYIEIEVLFFSAGQNNIHSSSVSNPISFQINQEDWQARAFIHWGKIEADGRSLSIELCSRLRCYLIHVAHNTGSLSGYLYGPQGWRIAALRLFELLSGAGRRIYGNSQTSVHSLDSWHRFDIVPGGASNPLNPRSRSTYTKTLGCLKDKSPTFSDRTKKTKKNKKTLPLVWTHTDKARS